MTPSKEVNQQPQTVDRRQAISPPPHGPDHAELETFTLKGP